MLLIIHMFLDILIDLKHHPTIWIATISRGRLHSILVDIRHVRIRGSFQNFVSPGFKTPGLTKIFL